MLRLLTYFSLLLSVISYKEKFDPPRRYHITGFTQGTTFQITYYASDSIILRSAVDSILQRIDTSMSLYNPGSLINRFNASAVGIRMDPHMARVVRKSIESCRETKGYFDITVAPLVKAWGFGSIKSDSIPDKSTIKKLKRCTGTDKLILRNDSLIKKKSCIQIDLNGIAQGYTVDVISDYISSVGINDFLVEVGGEIRTKGRKQPENVKMSIGIEAPSGEFTDPGQFQKIISLENAAITTSGNYRQYYESEGKRITHLINPFTGFPVDNELISVTVLAQDAITADAFDNALMLMGLKKALAFVERHKDLGAYFIYRTQNGQISDTSSTKFRELNSKN